MNHLPPHFVRCARPVLSTILILLDLLVITALLVIPAAWLLDPLLLFFGPIHFSCHWGLKPVLFAVFTPMVRAAFWRFGRDFLKINAGGLWRAVWYRRMVLSLAAIIIFFAAIEGVLAAVDFKYEMPAIIFEGKDESGGIKVSDTVPDSELLYRFKPGGVFAGRQINNLGFREREVDPIKQEGTIRVICMGDSVTAQGLPGYSEYLHELLTVRPPTTHTWEAFNMGVHGYSIQQGLVLFRRQARQLKPDIVTIYFGWNDHWLETQSDELLMAVRLHPVLGSLFDSLREKRIFMALHAFVNFGRRQKRDENDRVFRVPPPRYEQLLRQLVAEIRSADAVPVIITAARRSLTEQLVNDRRVRSIAEGEKIHDQYTEISRTVAKETGVPLFDLAEIFASPECDRYFAPDGIHFDQFAREEAIGAILPPEFQPGLRQIAVELHKFLCRSVSSQEWQKGKGS